MKRDRQRAFDLIFCIAIVIEICVVCIGCTSVTDGSNYTDESKKIELSFSHEESYAINSTSTICNDLEFLGIENKNDCENLALCDVLAIFPDKDTFFVYLRMPLDTEFEEYRMETVTINDVQYEVVRLEVDGCCQKYRIDNCKINDSNEYVISQIDFFNEKDASDTKTYNQLQLCVMIMDEESYYFGQEYRRRITLAGEVVESVYQFNKENSFLRELWYNIINIPEGLDEDKRSFYFFVFNCYDLEKDIHFIPDDILQLEAEYTELTYRYDGSKKDEAESIVPKRKEQRQTIEPDEVKVLGNDERRTNERLYEYETIKRLDDVSLSSDTPNYEMLRYAAQEYDWAVYFGSETGYRNVNERALLGKYEIDYTQIDQFNTIGVTYRINGRTFDVKTNTMLLDKPITVREKFVNPTQREIIEYRLIETWRNPHLSFLEKISKSLLVITEKPRVAISTALVVVLSLAAIALLSFTVARVKIKKKISGEGTVEILCEEISRFFRNIFSKDKK